MSFIYTVPPEKAVGLLKEIYDQDLKEDGYIANDDRALSLRPETILAWRNLIKTIRSNMDLRRYELVTIAAASRLRCSY
jgi:hypothetical protein